MTHLGSNWQNLVNFLRKDPRFDFFQTGHFYRHPQDLEVLTSHAHRKNNAAAVWSDVVLHNENFICWDLRSCCRFIYWASPFDPNHLELKNLSDPKAYYEYRFGGLKGSLRKTPSALYNPSLKDHAILCAILG